jgi:hypothetical protein
VSSGGGAQCLVITHNLRDLAKSDSDDVMPSLATVTSVSLEVNVKAKLSLSLTKHYAMKAYEGVDVQIHVFLT